MTETTNQFSTLGRDVTQMIMQRVLINEAWAGCTENLCDVTMKLAVSRDMLDTMRYHEFDIGCIERVWWDEGCGLRFAWGLGPFQEADSDDE